MNLRPRNEEGAIAVLVAILSVVILAASAISVDLGNAWARRRQVQTQVDVSTLSVGYMLPWTDATKGAIAKQVATNLLQSSNRVLGQEDMTPDQLAAGLQDNDPANGKIEFLDGGTELKVTAPDAWVPYGLGRIVSGDKAGLNVQASATIKLFSPLPPADKVLPFAMPDSCPFGPSFADAGNKKDTSGTPWAPTNMKYGTLDAISPASASGGSSSPVTMQVKISSIPKGETSASVVFTLGSAGLVVSPTSWTPNSKTTDTDNTRTFSVAVPPEVLDTPGAWQVWGIVKGKDTNNSLAFTVSGSAVPAPAACAGSSTGEFGQMYSPRDNKDPDQQVFGANVALGLDHNITTWANASQDKWDCAQKSDPPPAGGIQDKADATSTPNCILVQTGNDGSWMLRGLVTGDHTGTPQFYGRLDVSGPNGVHTKTGCGSGDDASRWKTTINNDHLTCFLEPGHSLAELMSTSPDASTFEGVLDPDVVKSPRFVWIPVIYIKTRSEIQNNHFYALKRFVPGFITDDGATDASGQNGLIGSNALDGLQVFTFNPLALPVDERSLTTPYDPSMGRIVHLVD